MADEDITLDGKPLQSLRVADLKAALEQRNLPKSGQKNTLIKRLKGALMLENLQRSSSTQSVLQPNSQIGEEMCQNSFIKQYLAKQQELLRQRLEREAQKEDDDDDESPAGPEEEDDEDNDSSSDKHQPSLAQSAVPDLRGGDSSFHHQEALETPRVRVQQATFQQGEPPAPSPPRAVASLSVRVVGQPDCQGFPLASPRPQEKEPAGLSQPGSAHPVLNLGRSAKSSAGNHVRDDSDEDDNDSDNEDEDWGPDPGRSGRQKRMPPSLPQLAPNMSSAASRSKRKLQPPQHILPPQVDPIPMQLRHPTPPPSPPPNLFPLPDTPKQSPPDDQERHGLREAQAASFHPPSMQRQDSDSSSRSSSPEPHVVRRPGPLSLLVHKMETEEASSARGLSEEKAHSTSGRSGESLPQHGSEKERKMKEEKEREQQQGLEKERRKTQEQEREKKRSGEKKEEKTRLEEERKRRQREEQEKERKRREQENDRKRKEEEKKREERRVKEEKEKKRKKASEDRMVAETQGSGSSSDSDSKSDSSSHSSSSSSSSSRDKTQTANQLKKADQKQDGEDEKKANLGKALEKQNLSKREVSEPSTAEVEPDSESSVAQQPASGSEPESSESRMEEVPMPLPLPILVPAAYYYHQHHQQHLFRSYSFYNSCPAKRKCGAGT